MSFDNSGYNVKFIQVDRRWLRAPLKAVLIFKFRSTATNKKYIIRCEYNEQDLFIVKFYLQEQSKSDYRYYLVSNLGDAPKVLMTVASVLPVLLNEYPTASFGFVGARIWDRKSKSFEPFSNTQRFRVYREIVKRLVGEQRFAHHYSEPVSGYLLLNRDGGDEVEKLKRIKELLQEHYLDID